MTSKEDGGRIERNIGELTEGSEVILAVFAGGTDPADGTGNHKGLKRVVGETRSLAFGGFIEEVWSGHDAAEFLGLSLA